MHKYTYTNIHTYIHTCTYGLNSVSSFDDSTNKASSCRMSSLGHYKEKLFSDHLTDMPVRKAKSWPTTASL